METRSRHRNNINRVIKKQKEKKIENKNKDGAVYKVIISTLKQILSSTCIKCTY